jgi:transcriptional regulator with XRE-family HTH domain
LKTVFTNEYGFLLEFLINARKAAVITQQDLAQRLNKPQSFVSKYERKERRLDVCEFVSIALAIGFDACSVIREIESRLHAQAETKRIDK